MAFRCVIVTPEQQELDESVAQAILPAHDGLPIVVGSRLRNVTGLYPGWNAHEWEVVG